MSSWSPSGWAWAWGWRRTVAITVLVLAPSVVGAALAPATESRVATATSITWLVYTLIVLLSAGMAYGRWRITEEPVVGWIAGGLLATAVQGIPFAMAAVATSTGHSSPITSFSLPIAVAAPMLLLTLLPIRTRIHQHSSPLVIGITLGLVAGTLRFIDVASGVDVSFGSSTTQNAVTFFLVMVIGLALSIALIHADALPSWARVRLVIVTAGLTLTQILVLGEDSLITRRVEIAVGLSIVCAVLLWVTTTALTMAAISEHKERLERVSARAESAEESVRQDEEVLHEVRSTVAAVSTASRLLMHHDSSLSPGQETRLERMMTAEMGRLERLLDGSPEAPGPAALDELIEPLVTSQRTQGRIVNWEPSGSWIHARPDDIAEVVHVLLTNAARHAAGVPVTVSVATTPDVVEVRVSDAGPGVPAALRTTLFERGTRGSDSQGQGIGLCVAQRLLADHGGSLCLEDPSPGSGATFVLSIPSAGSHR